MRELDLAFRKSGKSVHIPPNLFLKKSFFFHFSPPVSEIFRIKSKYRPGFMTILGRRETIGTWVILRRLHMRVFVIPLVPAYSEQPRV